MVTSCLGFDLLERGKFTVKAISCFSYGLI